MAGLARVPVVVLEVPVEQYVEGATDAFDYRSTVIYRGQIVAGRRDPINDRSDVLGEHRV